MASVKIYVGQDVATEEAVLRKISHGCIAELPPYYPQPRHLSWPGGEVQVQRK